MLNVTSVNDQWITGKIASGEAHYLNAPNRSAGDEITISQELATFERIA